MLSGRAHNSIQIDGESNASGNRRGQNALYFAFYNFCRIHKTLRMSLAMATGDPDRLWSLEDIVAKIDAMVPAPEPRGPYKKRAA